MLALPGAHLGPGEGHQISFLHRDGTRGVVTVPNPQGAASGGHPPAFLDAYVIAQVPYRLHTR